jgi:hypothetical protein
MQNPLNQIVPSVFGVSRLQDVSLDALHLLSVKYPYSAPIHLMYARRLKDSGDSRYGEAVSIAALHYANPHWLQHRLSAPLDAEEYAVDSPFDSTVVLEEAEAENREMEALPPDERDSGQDPADEGTDTDTGGWDTHTGATSPEPDTLRSDGHSETPEPVPTVDDQEASDMAAPPVDEDAGIESSDSPSESVTEITEPESAPVSETAVEISGASVDEDAGIESSDSPSESETEPTAPESATVSETLVDMSGASDQTDTVTEEPGLPSEIPSAPHSPEPISGDEKTAEAAEHPAPPEEGIESEQSSDLPPFADAGTAITTLYEGEATEASKEVGGSELIHVTMPDTGFGDTLDRPAVEAASEAFDTSSDGHPASGEGLPSLQDIVESARVGGESAVENPAASDSIPLSEELTLPVEPLHLSDYLASQGIVVSSELEPKQDDKGERSFTGWLRTMKRFQPDRSAPVLSEDEEDVIRSGAEASNLDEDIVTEAMAEVYARQGLIQKAIDVYSKLCLLDPDRTSTFADRISQLKALLT